MWGWLEKITKGATEAVIEEGIAEANKPNTTDDAETPEAVKKGWKQFVREKLTPKPPSN